jgi:hypothetical protein
MKPRIPIDGNAAKILRRMSASDTDEEKRQAAAEAQAMHAQRKALLDPVTRPSRKAKKPQWLAYFDACVQHGIRPEPPPRHAPARVWCAYFAAYQALGAKPDLSGVPLQFLWLGSS